MQTNTLYIALQELDPEEFPKRVKRIRQRKNEKDGAWKIRALEHLEALIEREREELLNAGATVSEQAELRVRDALAQEGEDPDTSRFKTLKDWAPLVPTVHPITEDSSGWPIDGEETSELRGILGTWVEATRVSKEAEANCDLDCLKCPTARLLSCGLQNKTAYEKDIEL